MFKLTIIMNIKADKIVKECINNKNDKLDLSLCYLTNDDLLEVINQLKDSSHHHDIKNLILDDNYLTKIPPEIAELKALDYLSIEKNSFYEFPVEVTKCENIETLLLNENPFHRVHNDISQLTSLKELDLSKTNIDSNGLPDSLTQLGNLTVLRLNNCVKLANNTMPRCFWNLNKLEKLELKFCNLQDEHVTADLVVPEIKGLQSLIDLDLTGNELNRLPPLFLFSHDLKYLTLDRNNEDFNLFGILDLKELLEISLVSLGIEEVPDEIFELPNLELLDLSDCKISSISQKFNEFLQKPSTQEVVLLGNPLSKELEEILETKEKVVVGEYDPYHDDDDLTLGSSSTMTEYLAEDSSDDSEISSTVNINADGITPPSSYEASSSNNLLEDDETSRLSGSISSLPSGDPTSSLSSEMSAYAQRLASLIFPSTSFGANLSSTQGNDETSRLSRSMSTSTTGASSSLSSNMSIHIPGDLNQIQSFTANFNTLYKGEGEMNQPLKAYIKLDNEQSFVKKEVFEDGEYIEKDMTVKQIVSEFIRSIPIEKYGEDEIYIPTAKSMLSVIFNNPESEEAKNMLSIIATCLGSCITPIKSLIIQHYLSNVDSGNLSAQTKAFFGREALEKLISNKLQSEIRALAISYADYDQSFGHEDIEIVQALLNSVFLSDRYYEKQASKLQISGADFDLESKTKNIGFGFYILSVSENLMKEFARLICKTDASNELLIKGGKYIFDIGKFNKISEEYLASLGIVSEREKKILQFQKEFDSLIYGEQFVELAYDNQDVIDFCDKALHEEKLRDMLVNVNESEIDNIVDNFLETKKETRNQLREKYKHLELNADFSSLLTPINVRGASTSTQLTNLNLSEIAKELKGKKDKKKGGRLKSSFGPKR